MKDQEVQGFPAYKKNDVVQVISGKYKGKKGKILRMIKDKGLIVIEKINMVKRHTKPTQKDPKGGIFEKEAPLRVCKVLPISTKTNKPVRMSVWLREGNRKDSKDKDAAPKKTKKPRGEK